MMVFYSVRTLVPRVEYTRYDLKSLFLLLLLIASCSSSGDDDEEQDGSTSVELVFNSSCGVYEDGTLVNETFRAVQISTLTFQLR